MVAALLLLGAGAVRAELAHVRGAEIARNPYGRWSARVLIEHEDESWNHFCDQWEVLDQEGLRIVFRHLAAPKIKDVEEGGPVRRRHLEFPIPEGTTKLVFRAHCKRSGWGGDAFELDLSRREGPGFEVRVRKDRLLGHFEDARDHMRSHLRFLVEQPVRWSYPPRGPIPARPPVPHDSRPREKRHFR